MPVVYVNGFAMSYRDAGGTGPPVIFVHGGFPSLATLFDEGPDDWEPWEAEVVAKFRLITFYRRGYHPSSCPKEGYSIDNQATDIAGLLDALAIEQAHLIGSSSGGPIAYCFAAHYPSRSRSLVLAGTGLNLRRTLRDRPDVRRLVLDEVEALRRYGPRSASSRRATVFAVSFEPVFMSEEFAERGQSREYEARLQQARERLAEVPEDDRVWFHRAEVLAMDAYLAWDGAREASAVQCPTLILHGERDRAISVDEGLELAALIPTARFIRFPSVSHSLLWTRPPALAAAIAFVAEVDAGRGTKEP